MASSQSAYSDVKNRLDDLVGRLRERLPELQTEESTKQALVLPFISALGYNVFNPSEVVPEYIADVGVKKGEKVDYAIFIDGKLVIIVECKKYGADLDQEFPTQLYRYFSVTSVRFAILTDGITYRLYSDLDQPNKMDSKAFFEFNLLQLDASTLTELKKFTKDAFDLESILSTANDLKYTREIKRALSEEWANPSEEFVRFFATKVYDGRLIRNRLEQFTVITRRAVQEFLRERINERLKVAMNESTPTITPVETLAVEFEEEPTEQEVQAFYAVKSILHGTVDLSRIVMRDLKSYCGVLLDDNNRKPICRFYFNRSRWYLGLFDEAKAERREPIASIDELFQHADALRQAAARYAANGG